MTGISESIDLDITAALAKVKQLDTAVTKAGKVNVTVDGAGLGNASSGLSKISTEARTAEKAVGGASGVIGQARAGLLGLAQTATNQVAPGLSTVTGHVQEIGGAASGTSGALLATAGVAVGLGLVLGKMALSGVKDVTALASSVRLVQRATGATAEDASRLVAVGRAVGVSAETQAAAFFKLSRNVAEHGDTLAADGISVARNKAGQVDLSGTLLNVADAYQKAGKGAAGNKVLFDAFGRSGLALSPILAQSREKLEEFYAAADRHHEILSQSDLDNARAYKLATYELGEAFSGLERELGTAVIPALTGFSKFLTAEVEGFDIAVHGIGRGIGALKDFAFGHKAPQDEAAKLVEEEKRVVSALDSLAAATGVPAGRLKQLADTMGIDLTNATDKETKALADAARKLNEAYTPTQRLAQVTDVLTNKYATGSESAKAFKEAVDATIGSQLTAQEASIRVRAAVSSLAEEIAKGQQKHESYAAYQDRVSSASIGLVRSITAEADALVKNGQLSSDAASQQEFLRTRLVDVANAVPSVREQILLYVAQLDKIPTATNTNINVNAEDALRKIGLVNDAISRTFAAQQAQAYNNPFVVPATGPLAPAANAGIAARQAATAAKAAADSIAHSLSSSSAITNAARSGSALGEAAGAAAAKSAAKAVETTLRKSAAPGEGLDLGGFIVAGIQLGAEKNKVLANNAALSLVRGMADVVKKAQIIDPTEQLGILEAVKNMDEAAKALGETRKKLGANSIEAAIAEQKLKQAQADVNTKTLAAIDATQAVTDALKKQKDAQDKARQSVQSYNTAIRTSYDGLVGALTATRSLAAAQRDLIDANRSLADAREREKALPAELAAADQALAAAKAASAQVTTQEALAIVRARQQVIQAQQKLTTVTADATATDLDRQEAALDLKDAQDSVTQALADSVGPTQEVADATQKVKDLQEEQAAIARRVEDATNAVTDATLAVLDAQKKVIDQADQLGNAQDKARQFFEAIATAAGFSKSQIDAMLASIDEALRKVNGGLAGSPLATVPGSSDPFNNTVTGRTAYTGPNGEAGSASRAAVEAYAKAHGIDPSKIAQSNVGGVAAFYIPGVAIDPGNLGAIAGLPAGQPMGGWSDQMYPGGQAIPVAAQPVQQPVMASPGQDFGTYYNQAPQAVKDYLNALAGNTKTTQVTINPKTAVFDEKTAGAYLRSLELLSS